MEIIITIIHCIFFLVGLLYAFIFPKNWFDMYYLLCVCLTVLSWTVFKGECIISVALKKYKDPFYQIGDSQSIDELTGVFGDDCKPFIEMMMKPMMLLQAYTIYLVLIRNKLSGWYAVLFFTYVIGLTFTANIFFQIPFFFIFLWILIKIMNIVWR